MYLTQSNVIRGLSKEEYSILRETCQYSNNLYNVALYNIRQYYFQDKKFLKYEENYHVCKENENYGLVNFHSKCKILGGVAEFFSKAFLCRFPPENFPRPVVYPVHSLPV